VCPVAVVAQKGETRTRPVTLPAPRSRRRRQQAWSAVVEAANDGKEDKAGAVGAGAHPGTAHPDLKPKRI
jgi:hypothetical protein